MRDSIKSTIKSMMAAAAMFACASARAGYSDYDCQVSVNAIGDWNIVTIGGFTFTRAFSVDLAPTNAPDADASYAIRCQVIYKDRRIERPATDGDLLFVRSTGNRLNEWLKELVADQYVGAECSELLAKYCDGRLTADLNARFSTLVAERIAAADGDDGIDVDAVTVTVEAEEGFRAALQSRLADAGRN